uniref:Calcium channel, voltage-dependent, alpha 2/delta subunit 1a n=1 Tax=Cyclopterus lumpus TaxID=8103 RepID=A0A8C2ZRD4_CYCLU
YSEGMVYGSTCTPMIKEWVDQMQKELITLTDTASGMDNLIQIYHKHRPHFSVETNDARHLVATAAGNIEKLLFKRSQALKVSDGTETPASLVFFLSPFLQLNETEEVKGRKNRYLPDDFEMDPDFKRLVSYNTTAVHIPTDIYEGSTIILNELNWTEALEDVFRKNKEEDPSLLWQVFGSATGLARYFPASPWTDSSNLADKIDLYDVRRRPWYIQGAASPKDMLILVDASGSVSGLTLKLIRTSVSKMLETLSDDDYVNVVYFNDKAMYAAACFANLVQANVRNKRMLKDAVQNITAKGTTNYRGGFELAFEQLAQMNVSRANCNKIIMLFTDGGEERAEEIFQKYNPKQVRIFTFSVGQHNYDKGPIQWMACANKGYYYEIPSIGAIRINTQEYLDVLGRPMVKADRRAKQVQWTNVYLDALELGLVITGTLPVFNKTNTGSKKSQNQLILGVMAIDVSLEDIKRLTPRFTFGPNGYYFAIDPNGYVLLHPNLLPRTAKFHESVTLDFLDAELENPFKVEIRKQMIDGQTGNYTMSTLVKSQDERYIDVGQRTYTFAPVKGTDYRTWHRGTISTLFLFPHRVYCKDLKPPDKNKNNTEFLIEFNDYIDTKTPNNPMLFQPVNVMQEHRGQVSETYESSFYKRSVDNDLYIFTPTPYLSRENSTEDAILVSKAVNLNIDGIILKPAVVGVKLDISAWMASFINTTQKINCNDEICGCQRNDVNCVILDDGGKAAAGLRSVYVPTIADILNLGWFATAAMDDEMSDAMLKEVCITEQTQYYFETNNLSFRGTIDCENCTRLYHAEKLPKTNLVFIIADAKLTCSSCDTKPLIQDEQQSNGPNPCELAQNPRYRKGPAVCFDNNEHVSGFSLQPELLGALWFLTSIDPPPFHIIHYYTLLIRTALN